MISEPGRQVVNAVVSKNPETGRLQFDFNSNVFHEMKRKYEVSLGRDKTVAKPYSLVLAQLGGSESNVEAALKRGDLKKVVDPEGKGQGLLERLAERLAEKLHRETSRESTKNKKCKTISWQA